MNSRIALVVLTVEIAYGMVLLIEMTAHNAAAISAVYQSAKYALFILRLFYRASLRVCDQCLNGFPYIPVDYGFMYSLEDDLVFLGIRISFHVLERLGVCFEVDDITAVFLKSKDLRDRCLAPFKRIILRFLTRTAITLAFFVCTYSSSYSTVTTILPYRVRAGAPLSFNSRIKCSLHAEFGAVNAATA